MHLPVIETGAPPWKGEMLPLHQRCFWRIRVSIPLPLASYASALPFELIPLDPLLPNLTRCEQDLNLRGHSPTDFKSVPLTTPASCLIIPRKQQ